MSVYHEFWHHLNATTSKTNRRTEGPHQGFIHITSMSPWLKIGRKHIKTTGGTLWIHSDLLLREHHFNSAWYGPSFEPWWPGLRTSRDADRVVRDEESEYPTQCENCCRNKVFRGSSVRYLCSHIWCPKFIQKLASKFNQHIAYHSLEASKQNDPAESRLEVDCFIFEYFWCFLFNDH